MLVYRICNELEKNILLKEKSFDKIAKVCFNDNKKNTHTYEDGKKYVHFFKSLDSVFYLKTTPNHYICTYDINEDVLNSYEGIGYYLDRMFLRKKDSVVEYAIESNLLTFSQLYSIDRIDEYIDFEDCIDGSYYDKLTNIYLKNEEISKKLILE